MSDLLTLIVRFEIDNEARKACIIRRPQYDKDRVTWHQEKEWTTTAEAQNVLSFEIKGRILGQDLVVQIEDEELFIRGCVQAFSEPRLEIKLSRRKATEVLATVDATMMVSCWRDDGIKLQCKLASCSALAKITNFAREGNSINATVQIQLSP